MPARHPAGFRQPSILPPTTQQSGQRSPVRARLFRLSRANHERHLDTACGLFLCDCMRSLDHSYNSRAGWDVAEFHIALSSPFTEIVGCIVPTQRPRGGQPVTIPMTITGSRSLSALSPLKLLGFTLPVALRLYLTHIYVRVVT